LSQEDENLLDELAQDVHLWPLLLSLVRGQLFHNLKQHKLSCHEAINYAQAKLHNEGLTALDKKRTEKSRNHAVQICIEVTLKLLTDSLLDKIKSLILWTGIGTSLEIAVLHNLWNITEHEARNIADELWCYGLIQYTDNTMPPLNDTQRCVEVHAVISQYIIIEYVGSNDIGTLWGTDFADSIHNGLFKQFQKRSGVYNTSTLGGRDYLKYMKSEIENHHIPYLLKRINTMSVIDPHLAILTLQRIQDSLIDSPKHSPSINDEIKLLISNCHKVLKDVHNLSRKFNQNVQKCLTQGNYHNLLQVVETYSNKYPTAMIVQQAVTTVNKIISQCDGELLNDMDEKRESLMLMMPDYNILTVLNLSGIKLFTELLHKIHISLWEDSSDIEALQHYFLSGQHSEETKLLVIKYYSKLQEVAPNKVHEILQGL